jgi:hypothetical protein
LILGLLPALIIPILAVGLLRAHTFAFDFHGWYWPAGTRVLNGLSPYSLPMIQALHYPAVGALLFVPFAVLPHVVADWTFTVMVLACVPATLWVLGVRDWRLYAMVMLWQPVVYGWETANITLPMVLGVAVLWRYRDRARLAGALLALLISVKLFLVPLAVWLIATRRYTALAWAAGITAVLNALAWPLIGLGQLSQYLHVLHAFTERAQRWGYSLISLLLHGGVQETGAYALALLLAGAVLLGGVLAGRREDDHRAMTTCLAACLIASPIVEVHYLSLLIIPLAVARPRLTIAWALPVVLWLAPVDHPADWQRILALCIFVAVIAASMRPSTSASMPDARSPSPTLV